MEERVCPNCGESCEKEYETLFVNGQEFCVCCNSNIDPCFREDNLNGSYQGEEGGINNVFTDFFNESGLIKYHE